MLFYITDETSPVENILLFRKIDGYHRAKNLRKALMEEEPDRYFAIHITKSEYMWAIEGESYYSEPTYYIFETWDEAADFGHCCFANFNTDTDIIELDMV